MKKRSFVLAVAVLMLMSITSAQAGTVVWGNSASQGNVNLEAFDSATGLLIPGQQFLVPNLTARLDNGRGVAILGNDIYYTTANSGNIYKTNVITHADLGIVVNTGFSGIANIATDGTFLYANDYQATNGVINKYTPAGLLVGSITLSGPDAVNASARDGFEVQNNPNILAGATTFIANRYDGGYGPTHDGVAGAYDVYNSAGVEIISGFITPNANGTTGATGIAYDGNHYFVSDIQNNRLFEYDGLGVFVGVIDLSANPNPPSGIRLLEDLSAVGNTDTNPGCGNNAVDPGEQCDGSDDAACPGQCRPAGDPNQCTCGGNLCAGVVCTPSDQCRVAGTCDPRTGLCSDPVAPDGTPCKDGNLCTTNDTCRDGACVGGLPLDCNDRNVCTSDTCDPEFGCVSLGASSTSTIAADFNGTRILAGSYIWFNSNFKASGIMTKTTITLRSSSITFTASSVPYTLAVPDADITFDPAASCASTTFDTGLNRWKTTVPLGGSDEVFLSGLSFLVPVNFPGGIKPVAWTGVFQPDQPNVSIDWKWGAAVYTTDISNYNALGVKPAHTNTCAYSNSDHAGTPENAKSHVKGGARGGGGSEYTGSWSGTTKRRLPCSPLGSASAGAWSIAK